VDGDWGLVAASSAIAVIGWWVGSLLLALVGVLGAACVLGVRGWWRQSLTGVTYRRSLGQHRATFGEDVTLDLELVNDKLLPLTWLHVEDKAPPLTIHGGTVVTGGSAWTRSVNHLVPMLPYQRLRRHLRVTCDRRGAHVFGPATVRSGDPIGYRDMRATVAGTDELLVYPKVFELRTSGIASLLPQGDIRSALALPGDPTRVVGVRDYREGDPLRHVDWRASARSSSLLVRVFEPTVSVRAAVFADFRIPYTRRVDADETEFVIAVAASVVSDLAGRGVGVGLFSTATIGGVPVAHTASTSPAALPQMLEMLARASAFGPLSLADILVGEGTRLSRGTSVVVVSANFGEATLVAIAELRRRLAVTSVWVATGEGQPPPDGFVDAHCEALYTDDWHGRTTLELAA
jgi:uncharacterized protein (DUF58 family)